MHSIQNISQFGVVPVNYDSLKNIFEEYRSPEDKIERLETSGELIRLKKGLYVISPERTQKSLSKELIANHLLGPSYISLHSALSYYGLIPERVYLTMSVTTKRAKKYKTPIGEFSYITVNKDYYPIGIKIQFVDQQYSFLMASPEKALCDLILYSKRINIKSVKGMRSFLENDIRFDIDALKTFDANIITECADKTTKKRQEILLLHQIIS